MDRRRFLTCATTFPLAATLGIGALALIFPGVWTDLAGLTALVVGFRGGEPQGS